AVNFTRLILLSDSSSLTLLFASLFFFFLLTPPPPTSPLFPYTTLFRSQRPVSRGSSRVGPPVPAHRGRAARRGGLPPLQRRRERSEEHTSELQSRVDLVCRLLLEKKKTRINRKERTENNIQRTKCITYS